MKILREKNEIKTENLIEFPVYVIKQWNSVNHNVSSFIFFVIDYSETETLHSLKYRGKKY